MKRLAKCPNCNSADVRAFEVSTTAVSDERRGKYYVECWHCHTMTDYVSTFVNAAYKWQEGYAHVSKGAEFARHCYLMGDRVRQLTSRRWYHA